MAMKKKAPKAGPKASSHVGGKRILNCVPSRETEKDWGFSNAAAAGLATAANIPASKDLRTGCPWWTVNNQGSTGSCVGWATADSVLRWHFVKANRLAPNKLLSPRFTWMASKEFDEFTRTPTTFIESAGTSLKAALDIARKYGSVEDNVLQFGSGQLYQGEEDTFYLTASRLKIASYVNLGLVQRNWKAWIANNGPILTRLDVDDTWMNAGASNPNLVTYDAASVDGGHAVAIVGYTPTTFIVRNSWGKTDWGNQGYGYATYAYAAKAFTEAYGVTI
jgi:C1A family cysteine protease